MKPKPFTTCGETVLVTPILRLECVSHAAGDVLYLMWTVITVGLVMTFDALRYNFYFGWGIPGVLSFRKEWILDSNGSEELKTMCWCRDIGCKCMAQVY